MQFQEDRSVDNIWMKKYNYRQQIARLKVLQITDTKKGRNTDNRWIYIDEQQTIENRQQD